jgi:hypothetical protein
MQIEKVWFYLLRSSLFVEICVIEARDAFLLGVFLEEIGFGWVIFWGIEVYRESWVKRQIVFGSGVYWKLVLKFIVRVVWRLKFLENWAKTGLKFIVRVVLEIGTKMGLKFIVRVVWIEVYWGWIKKEVEFIVRFAWRLKFIGNWIKNGFEVYLSLWELKFTGNWVKNGFEVYRESCLKVEFYCEGYFEDWTFIGCELKMVWFIVFFGEFIGWGFGNICLEVLGNL